MSCNWRENSVLAAGLLMELIYLCSDGLAPVERMAGNFGALLTGAWIGLAIALMLVGLARLSPKGRALIARLAFWKKS